MPLIRGEIDAINDEIFAEVTHRAAYEPPRAVRTQRYKYIRRFDDRPGPVLPNCEDSPSKDLWLRCGWSQRRPPSEHLYDLVFHPNETGNLVDDPAVADVLDAMRRRLDRWMPETDDPLLGAPVLAPKGARVNDPNGRSPREAVRGVS